MATRRSRSVLAPLVLVALSLLVTSAASPTHQQDRLLLGEQEEGGFLVPTNQVVTPIGVLRRLEGVRPKDMALSPNGQVLAVLATNRIAFFAADGTPVGEMGFRASALGIAWAPDGQVLFASSGDGKVYRIAQVDGSWKTTGEIVVDDASFEPAARSRQPANPQPTGLAVSPDGRRLYVALGIRNAVAVIELPAMTVAATIAVGVAPYHLTLSPDGRTLAVANRGGRVPAEGDGPTALSAGSRVRIDPVTDAALVGSVSLLDTRSLTVRELEVGRQPAGMAISADNATLYVAHSDEDSISVVDLRARRVVRTVAVRPRDDPGFGQIPTDVALSGDGTTLYVACGGGNAVAVIRLRPRPRVTGYLPAAWFPVAIEERAGHLFVACAKGIGARLSNPQGKFGVHNSVGAVQFVPPAARQDLASLTRQVADNNRWGGELRVRPGLVACPVPERVGEPSVFRYVVYIIKENMTYDVVLGDLPQGNGDPSLTLFGEEVSPNHHALAREFVLLDNTYTSGTNSADGHQWTSSSVANAYIEQNYAAHTRSYPYDGGDPLAYSPAGFLWTAARRAGLSVRVYGEFVNQPRIVDPTGEQRPTWENLWRDYQAGTGRFQITAGTDNAALRPFLHPHYIGFPTTVSDQWRADQFLADLDRFEAENAMPSLCILLLPNDHTTGTRPGMPTPRAQVADNDLALGRIVDRLSHSRFWPEMLILVVEDDSQLGLDHVDGHRMAAFCISPYTRRGTVVSEPYNHTSFVRTMGLVLGFPALNRFDRSATPLTACFTSQPDLTPYRHRPNRIPLDEMNPPASALQGEARRLALASDRLDWSDVDRADATTVARAVWYSRRPGEPFPWQAFHPNLDDDD